VVFSMVHPTRRNGSAKGYFRRRLPADLLDKIKGRKLTVRIAGASGLEAPEVTATALINPLIVASCAPGTHKRSSRSKTSLSPCGPVRKICL
jgi:hypothetical protein